MSDFKACADCGKWMPWEWARRGEELCPDCRPEVKKERARAEKAEAEVERLTKERFEDFRTMTAAHCALLDRAEAAERKLKEAREALKEAKNWLEKANGEVGTAEKARCMMELNYTLAAAIRAALGEGEGKGG